MRYIRFLKTPRVVTEKGTGKSQISCLITITSDLGDSFLPYDLELSAELLSSQPSEEIRLWRAVHWTAGMRSLPITFPLTKTRTSSKLRVRIGTEPKSTHDTFDKLFEEETCGVVSAWSSEFNPFAPASEAEKLVERRFDILKGPVISIYEETGESIARHLWDAGIALACEMSCLNEHHTLTQGLSRSKDTRRFRILELGAGCGIVGIAIAQVLTETDVTLTDLPEAQEIIERNISRAHFAKESTLAFQVLDWDAELPRNLSTSSSRLDLVVAADCTYNSDSSPALVKTLVRLAQVSPEAKIAIAMKMRHPSETIFFDLMAAANFRETTVVDYPLPGDVNGGGEKVHLHVYQYIPVV